MGEFVSNRKKEELKKKHIRDRFEFFMSEEDYGRVTREMALLALREEIEFDNDLSRQDA